MNDIILKNVVKRYGSRTVLDGFSCSVRAGSVCLLTGESGSGKTTLIRLLAGLEKPDTGEITGRGSASVVFQEDRLVRHMTAVQNCLLVCADAERTAAALDELGLDPCDRRPVSAYSGGMARRVALARALLAESDALLLDEPFRGLDEERIQSAAECIMRRRNGRTLVLVTHSESEAGLFGFNGSFGKELSLTVINDVDIR